MSEKTRDEEEQDMLARSMGTGSIYLTAFFKPNDGTRKFTNGGVTFRYNIRYILWGVISGGLVFGLLTLANMLLGEWGPFFIFTSTFARFFWAIVIGAGMASLSTWSPYKNSTGEGLLAYLVERLRQRIEIGGLSGSKPARSLRVTMVKKENGRPRKMETYEYLGTVPLIDFPYFDFEEEDMKKMETVVDGKILPSSPAWEEHDGLDRS